MTHQPPSSDTTIEDIVGRLSVKFPQHSQEKIREIVTQAYAELDDAHVRDFVEVLVEKAAKKRLKNLKD